MSYYHVDALSGANTSSRGVLESENFRALSLSDKQNLYFGKPNFDRRPPDDEDMHPAENRTRPYEWIGKNRRIEMLLIRKITNAEDFMIRFVLPIKDLPQGGKITVTQVKFNDMSLDQIPEQGTGRLTTQTVRRWELSIERHGLAFMMEDGFAMTDMGIQQYNASILQISNATVDMMVLDAYYNLLTAPQYSGNPYQQYGITHSNPTRNDLFAQEKDLWSILTKTPFGFWRMSGIGNNVFKARQVVADILIMPSGSREYLKRNRPETIQYSSMGERAVTAYLGKGYLQSIDGIDVYESSLYNVRESEVPEDPLSRIRAIGEFGDSLHFDNTRGMKRGDYTTELRTRTIHDNASDSMKPLTLQEMFSNSGLFTTDGRQSVDFGKPFFAGHRTLGSYLRDKPAIRKALLDQIVWMSTINEGAALAQKFTDDWEKMCQKSVATHNGTSVRPTKSKSGFSAVTGASAAGSRANELGLFEANTGGKSSSGSSSSSGSAETRWIYTMPESELVALQATKDDKSRYSVNALMKSAISLQGGGQAENTTFDLAPIFAQFKRSRSMFDADSVRVLLDVLRGERGVASNAKLVGKTPHMVFLRWHFRTPNRQMELYDTPNVRNQTVTELLRLIYSDVATKHAVQVNGLMRAHMTGTSRVGQAEKGFDTNEAVDEDSGRFEPEYAEDALGSNADKLKFRKMMISLEALHTEINAYCPRLITGVYALVVKATGSLAQANAAVNTFVEIADWLVATLGKLPKTSQNTVSWKEKNGGGVTADTNMSDCAQAIQSALMDIQTAADVELIADAWQNMAGKGKADIQDLARKLGANLDDEPAPATTDPMALPITAHFFQFCIDENLPFPFDFIFTRPSMSYEVGSAIMLKKGTETGASFYGEPDFQLSNEGARKVLFGFFTVYAGARVWKHQNVFVFPFIHCRRYLGGGNMECFNNGDSVHRDKYMLGETEGRSIFIHPIHNGERISGSEMDITGYFPDQMDSHNNSQFSAHYSSCEMMKLAWGWTTISRQYEPDHFSDTRAYNTVCFRMTQFMPRFDRGSIVDRGYGKSGQGHWGQCVYAGVRDDRCGRGPNGYVDKQSFQIEASGTKWI